MNYIIKKAGMSMLSGAACMFGSWMTKYMLEASSKKLNKQLNKKKVLENGPT